MKTLKLAMIMAIILAIVSGCGKLRPGDRNISYYSLEYAPPISGQTERLPVAIRIERFRISPMYDSSKIIYREKAFKLDSYVYHKWWANPADLTAYFLSRDFQHSGYFKAVFSPANSVHSTHILDGFVEEFFEEDDTESWKAVLSLNIYLLQEDQPDVTKRILMQKKYTMTEPCTEKTPHALAKAMSVAMSKISEQMIRDVCDVLKREIRRE